MTLYLIKFIIFPKVVPYCLSCSGSLATALKTAFMLYVQIFRKFIINSGRYVILNEADHDLEIINVEKKVDGR